MRKRRYHKPGTLANLDCDSIERSMRTFEGDIEQLPPIYSAIKVDGRPLYKAARKGQEVELKARPVHVERFEMTRCQLPEVEFVVDCGKGTYIRSLAHDLGKKLENGAYLTGLRRTRIGEYLIEDAWNLEQLIQTIGDEVSIDKQNATV